MLRLVPFFALLLAACGHPCTDLSNTICNCEKTESAQQACQQRVKAENDATPPSDSQEKCCQDILDRNSCTCDKLAAGDLAACGLTEQNDPGVCSN